MTDVSADSSHRHAPAPSRLAARPAAREPVVLPFEPRRGWQSADIARRAFAVACPVLLLAWLVLALLPRTSNSGTQDAAAPMIFTVWSGLFVLLGPPACYSLARVLRPYPNGAGGERPWRHWCAAVATALGLPVLLLIVLSSSGGMSSSAGVAYVCIASSLGPATIAWGAVAALIRASRSG